MKHVPMIHLATEPRVHSTRSTRHVNQCDTANKPGGGDQECQERERETSDIAVSNTALCLSGSFMLVDVAKDPP